MTIDDELAGRRCCSSLFLTAASAALRRPLATDRRAGRLVRVKGWIELRVGSLRKRFLFAPLNFFAKLNKIGVSRMIHVAGSCPICNFLKPFQKRSLLHP